MSPFFLFLIAILTPLLIPLVLLVPAYAGIAGAAYVIYMPDKGAHPLAARLDDVFYMLDVYGKLFEYWWAQPGTASLIDYTLPLIGLPAAGILFALWATYRVVRGLINLFRLSASV